MNGESFLQRMATGSRDRVRAARALESEAALARRAADAPAPPPLRLNDFDLIAELKLRSPAAGELAAGGFDRDAQVSAYARAGAAAVSVLTEPAEFRGDLEHLRQAAELLKSHRIPVMRKDFLTDPYQVLEARAAGAGGVLIIVAMLEDGEIGELLAAARDCGLFALLEAFDRDDLERIAALAGTAASHPQGLLAGVNCRDLKDLSVSFDRFATLAPYLPPGLPAVAESGVRGADDIRTVATLGYELALVGSALMQQSDPAQTAAGLIAVGRDQMRVAGAGATSCS
jgi:indole-3-glycerol phosphate synthase